MSRYITFILLVCTGLWGCSSEWLSAGDYFFLKNKGAVMPVWVTGNLNSGTYIVVTHGGPGATTGHDFHISIGFKELEEKYALVYWDQRASGLSQGDAKPETLTIDQHVEDLSLLIDLIRQKYDPQSLFLMGHSWGGVLTGKYLGRENNQEFFNGWIDLDGSIEDVFEQQAKKEWILERVPEYYDEDPEFWQYILDWYDENPNPVESDWEPYTYVGALGGYAYDWELSQELSPIPYSELVFSSPFTFAFYFSQYSEIAWMDGYDSRQEVSNIEIPTLLLWGREDGAVPPSTADLTYSLLATPEADKQVVLIDSSAHSPHFDTPDEFEFYVSQFVERYQ